MSDRPTPETDSAQCEGLLRTNPIPMQVVTANFARKLEQERDEAREQIEVCRGIIERTVIARNSALSELTDLERELDEARKETEYYKARYEQLKERPENPKWYNNREIPAKIKEETK